MLPVKFVKFLRTPIFKSICERLLLHLKYYNPAKNTAEAFIKFSKTVAAEEEMYFKTEEFYFHNVCLYKSKDIVDKRL